LKERQLFEGLVNYFLAESRKQQWLTRGAPAMEKTRVPLMAEMPLKKV